MISQAGSTCPPYLAAWLITLFSPSKEAECVLGDLLEEYSHMCSDSGVAFARSWYWRQTLKTIADFTMAGYRAAPWSTIAAILGGWLLNGFLHGLLDKALSAVTDKYLLYWSNHFKLYLFLAGNGMLIGNLIASTLVGAVVGFAARGREMVATMALSLVLGAMAVIGYLVLVLIGRHIFFGGIAWYFAGLCAIVVGGAVVRMSRSRRQLGPLDAQLHIGS
jgi:hypothetical protein